MLDQDEDANILKILLASDIHLGYAEKDPIRGNDSFATFEEILQIALKNNVDFMLLGGDLFHDNKPSRPCMHSCVCLLRKYCFGENNLLSLHNNDKSHVPSCANLKYLSDPSMDFADGHFGNVNHFNNLHVNYLDPDINITLPVFSIHGNHDDPTGRGNLSSIDLLSAFGLINHFGKNASGNLETIRISPVLLQKGNTKLALYGLGSMRDERLHRLFANKNVIMLRPKEDTESWFNLMVIHQNRIKHGPTNYIPEHFLEEFLDLVLWGHEHECLIDPEWNAEKSFFVTQPGSSVATSLSTGEAVPKHVGLLQIKNKSFKLTKIPLQTVRPFCIRDINLVEDAKQELSRLPVSSKGYQKKVQEYLHDKVCELIEMEVPKLLTAHPQQPTKPLIRLRIEYSENLTFLNPVRFGQKFVDTVANPKDIIHFYKKNSSNDERREDNKALKSFLQCTVKPTADISGVEDLVASFLENAANIHQLSILTEKGLGNAVREYINKHEYDAVNELVNHQLNKIQQDLVTKGVSELVLDQEIEKFKEERILKYATQEQIKALSGKNVTSLPATTMQSNGLGQEDLNGILMDDAFEDPLEIGDMDQDLRNKNAHSLLRSERDEVLKDYDNPFENKVGKRGSSSNLGENENSLVSEESDNSITRERTHVGQPVVPKAARARGRGRGSRGTASKNTSIARQQSILTTMGRGKENRMGKNVFDKDDIMIVSEDLSQFCAFKKDANPKTANSSFSSLLLDNGSNSISPALSKRGAPPIIYDSDGVSELEELAQPVENELGKRGKSSKRAAPKSAITSQLSFSSYGKLRKSPRKKGTK